MSLKEEMEHMKLQLELISAKMETPQKKKVREKKIPSRSRREAKKGLKDGKIMVVWLGSNRHLSFPVGQIEAGLITVNDKKYKLDHSAIYMHRRLPAIVLLEWRLEPAGGEFDKVVDHACGVGGAVDQERAKELSVIADSQQTIIRGIEQVEIEKDAGKKKKKISPIVWIVIAVIAMYLIGKSAGIV